MTVSQWVRPMGSQKIDSGPSPSDQRAPIASFFGISLLYLVFRMVYLVFSQILQSVFKGIVHNFFIFGQNSYFG